MPARNLAIAERDGLAESPGALPDVLDGVDQGPLCPGGFGRRCAARCPRSSNSTCAARPACLNLIQVFQRVGLEKIREGRVRPLTDFRPACYYGCLLTRPPATLQFDDCEQPSSMETMLRGLGRQPVEWSCKTECCGAGMTMADEDTVLELSQKVLDNARQHGANCLVVACPMCHVNLDMKQPAMERRYGCRHDLVVYYLSDLVGLALGLDEADAGHRSAFRGETVGEHGANRRFHLLVRREHRPERRRAAGGRRGRRSCPAWSASRPTSTCAPIRASRSFARRSPPSG